MMNTSTLQHISQQQSFAEEYASYSLSRGGIGKVLGGVIGIFIILWGTLMGAGTWTAVITISLTFVWLFGKEVIRAKLYRPFGDAVQMRDPAEHQTHLFVTGFVTVVSLFVLVTQLTLGRELDQPQTWIYLFFSALLPVLTLFFLKTSTEFIVGVFLLAACAVHGAGANYSLIPANFSLTELGMIAATWSPFLGSLILIRTGWQEHQRFQVLKTKLRNMRDE
jgi:hypothetical protein